MRKTYVLWAGASTGSLDGKYLNCGGGQGMLPEDSRSSILLLVG